MGIPFFHENNIGWKVNQDDLKNLTKQLQKLGHIISDPNMQLYRAKKYREFTIDALKNNKLILQPLLDLTKQINGHDTPGYMHGDLVEQMMVKPVGKNAAEAGYWSSDTQDVPSRAKSDNTTKMTYAKLAILMHTGFRVRLSPEKFANMAAWFRGQGINLKRRTQMGGTEGSKNREHYLVWPPRPFMLAALYEYEASGKDVQAVDEFLDKMMNSPIDTSTGSAARKVAKDKEEV